jgi:hypothetical protein
MNPLIKENQYLVDTAVWGLWLYPWSSKVVAAPPAPVHAAPDAAAAPDKKIGPNYNDLHDELRQQIHELTASKFVVEELNRNMSDRLEGEISVRRLNRFEFELQPRQRRPEGEFSVDYAEAGSPEISVTYSLVLDPAHRESDKYKKMESQDREKFNLKELTFTSHSTQHWLKINNVCVESEIDGWGWQHTLLKFYQNDPNDPMDLTKQIEVTCDNQEFYNKWDKYKIWTDCIIQQVRELLQSKFQMVLEDRRGVAN